MKRGMKFLIVGLMLICLIGMSAASASAFDFIGWMKRVLGIQEQEEPNEIFVPIEDIPIEEPEEDEEMEEETEEEVDQGESSEEIVIVEETELISLQPDASDPDEDQLTFSYTDPLDDQGEWQTTYGDAGEYTVTISVTDGTLSDSKDVLILVNRKEEAPTIDDYQPEALELAADENSEMQFTIQASDLNDDELTYTWLLDGEQAEDGQSFLYDIGYDAAGSHTVEVVVFDGLLETSNEWSLDVNNVNRIPEMQEIDDMTVEETEEVAITPVATDPDGDEIIFTISEPVGDDGIWRTTYDDSGIYEVEIVASDGEDSATQTVMITVENVNRAPVIRDIIQQ